MAASKKHAVGKAIVMSKARWDNLSEGDKWRIYSGARPGSAKKKAAPKKKTQLGKHGGGKERTTGRGSGRHQSGPHGKGYARGGQSGPRKS